MMTMVVMTVWIRRVQGSEKVKDQDVDEAQFTIALCRSQLMECNPTHCTSSSSSLNQDVSEIRIVQFSFILSGQINT